MKIKSCFVCSVLLFVLLAAVSCNRRDESAAPAEIPAAAPSHASPVAAPAPAAASAAGIEWTVPSSWTVGPPRQMRVATYAIPAASGDSEGAECAVFYFGSGQGGDVRSNINRWTGQFESASKPQESSRTVNGIPVTIVAVDGTYLAPSGPMMQSQGKKPGYRLFGAIVEAPEGNVFFKTTGPAATMAAAERDILALVESVRKLQ